jgi:arsenate reductase-like glutaredoxin family protein
MKPLYTSVLAILVTVTIVGMLTISPQQLFAPRTCGECSEFKKLTNEFEKAVIDIGSTQPPEPDKIQMLLDDYSDDVMALFREPSTSP